jgi:predicted small metal-binding protein
MGGKLECRDLGFDCDYATCAQNDREILRNLGDHIQVLHGMKGFSKDFYRKALSSIRDRNCEKAMTLDDALCEACYGLCTC